MNEAGTLAGRLTAWRGALPSEARFWDLWIRTEGHIWPDEFAARFDPTRPLPPHVADHVAHLPSARILDVGAGPVTALGRVHPTTAVDLVACDPLAPVYDELLARYGRTSPTRTVQAFAEDLTVLFAPESFDVVYCQNALDHSFEPLRGIEEMLIVAKVGGKVVLSHATDEAEHERYVGLHQWNFNERDGRFVIWNRAGTIDVAAELGDVARVSVSVEGRNHSVVIEKLRPWPEAIEGRALARLATLLAGLLDARGVVATMHVEEVAPAPAVEVPASPRPLLPRVARRIWREVGGPRLRRLVG